MTTQDTITNVIDKYGVSVTFTPKTSQAYSEDTGWSEVDGTPYATNVVPYNNVSSKINFQEYGNNPLADTQLIGKGTVSFEQGTTFVYNNKTYKLTRVNPLPLEGVNLAFVLDGMEVL